MTASRPPLQLLEGQAEFQNQNHSGGHEIEIMDAPPSSNRAGPPKLEIRVGVRIDPAGTHDTIQPSEGEQLFGVYPSTTMDVIELASQPQSVASEIAAAERSRLPPLVPPKRSSASPHSGSNYDPEVQSNPSTSDVAFHDKLQSELTKESELREKAESELRKTKTEVKDIRQRWKLAARELDKIQRQGQPSGFYQVTDNYLIDLTTRLRYNIRNISIQYFSEPLGKVRRLQEDGLYRFMESTTPGSDDFLNYLINPVRRPKVIQAFLWKVLVERLFSQFRWAGMGSDPIWKLYDVLPKGHRLDTDWKICPNPEAEKRYHVWRATTVGLLLDSMDKELSREADEKLQRWKTMFFDDVEAVVRWYRTPYNEGYKQEFLKIIDEALELDKEISRQVAGVQLVFQGKGSNPVFDSSTMELEKGEKVSGSKQKVFLVTSPAVVKRGKSTGESFNEATLLLRMEVSCEEPRP